MLNTLLISAMAGGHSVTNVYTGSSSSALYVSLDNGESGLVCDDSFGDAEASTACYEILNENQCVDRWRYSYQTRFSHPAISWDFAIDDVHCPGWQHSLNDCTYRETHNCRRGEAVRLECTPLSYCGGDSVVRTYLGGKSSALYVKLADGTQGLVCDDLFGDDEAATACFDILSEDDCVARWGYKWQPAYRNPNIAWSFAIDNVQCPGWQHSFNDCRYDATHNCRRGEAVRLECSLLQTCSAAMMLGASPTLLNDTDVSNSSPVRLTNETVQVNGTTMRVAHAPVQAALGAHEARTAASATDGAKLRAGVDTMVSEDAP